MPSQFRRLPAKQTRFSRKANPSKMNCKQGNFQCGAVCKPLKNRNTGKDTNCPSNQRLGMATTALAWLEDRQRRLDAVNQKREKTGRRRYEMNQGKVQPLPPAPKKMETETKPRPTPAPEKKGRASQTHARRGPFGLPKTPDPVPAQPKPAQKKGGASPKQIAFARGILYELTDRNPSNPNLSVTAWVGELNKKGRREYANYVKQVLGAVRKADPIWIIDNRQFLKTPAFKENVDLLGRRLGIPIDFSERSWH